MKIHTLQGGIFLLPKRLKIALLFVLIAIFSAGCTAANPNNPLPINPEGGIWDKFFVYPLSWMLQKSAEFAGGSYGVAILIVTVLVRLAILPLMVKQMKSSKKMQELQPEMMKLRDKYKNDPQRYQQEMIKLYQVHQINPLSGCLPIIIQMPILLAFYHAIIRTGEIRSHDFLWLQLGAKDPFLPVLAAATTYLQQWMMMRNSPATAANPQMKMMLYLMPVMILVISVTLPSALSLYWVYGNIFIIAQTYFLYRNTAPVESTTPKPKGGKNK
ncbi:membrane protein insertase YidC [Aneurinibacillus aneurinilyticus]|uniref:Membrane protein insertase YidC n=1 Tax=Aneurinibacillus aneurinilyticus ATCC 12856 TaxID=649747 RepID=U1Y1Q5_ANEAE|nr:membrane protein insertase YidC [Aneurinibacillus aneurinilyticus]ERI04871.1 OxaA-like protein [Aneurinibacillus aneurinilyticus ATCC 12856]MED0705996.1 membrane protein insertase YidC [Aneurinibacillus aneurinilyticus]MED0730916.1 membrane protein insertase YidC [Aneurinibacillus aneurinilyticus]MED0742909.1 membrane protein insertase YidC [Aneurinibacillus aneurinilyticus]